MQIVCFDPSMSNWGIAQFLIPEFDLSKAFLTHLRLVSTGGDAGKSVRKSSDDLRRASILQKAMGEACVGSSLAIAEVPHGSQSARASLGAGMCIGVLASCPIPLIQVSANEVKMASFGKKDASKREMIDWAEKRWPNAPWIRKKLHGVLKTVDKNEHLADACATFEAGILTDQFQQALAMARAMNEGKVSKLPHLTAA